MTARHFVVFGLLVAVFSAHADEPFDHSKTRFPLSGRHQKVACESCHPASGGRVDGLGSRSIATAAMATAGTTRARSERSARSVTTWAAGSPSSTKLPNITLDSSENIACHALPATERGHT